MSTGRIFVKEASQELQNHQYRIVEIDGAARKLVEDGHEETEQIYKVRRDVFR